MKISKISFENIGVFTNNNTISIDEVSINYILGMHSNDINRSNASGKTTLINIILYGIFDKSIYGDSVLSLINKNYEKSFIEVDFLLRGIKYNLVKEFEYKKEKVNKKYLLKFSDKKIEGVANVNEYMKQILQNIDNMFFFSFTNSDMISNFISSTNIQRYNIMCSLMNLNKIITANKQFKKELPPINEKVIKNSTLIENNESNLKEIKSSLKKCNKKNIETILDKIKKEKDILREGYTNFIAKQEFFQTEINELNKKLSFIKNNIHKINSTKENIVEKEFLKKELEKDIISKRENYNKSLSEQKEFLEKSGLNNINEEEFIRELDLKNKSCHEKLYLIKDQLDTIDKDLAKYKLGVCPKCNRKFENVEKIINELNDNKKSLLYDKKNNEELLLKTETEKESYLDKKRDYLNIIDNTRRLKEEGISLKEKINNTVESINKYTLYLKEMNYEDPSLLEKNIEEKKLSKKKLDEKVFEEKSKIDVLEEKYDNINKDYMNIIVIEKRAVNIENSLKDLFLEKENLENEKSIIDGCIYATNLNTGLIPMYVKYYSELIENTFNQYNHEFFNIDYDLQVDIEINSKKSVINFIFYNENKKVVFSQLSGAERFISYILIKIAMKELFYKKDDFDIIIFDEPFGTLDASSRYKLQMFIKELNNNFYSQIFYTTHNELDVENTNIIKINKDKNNFSKVI